MTKQDYQQINEQYPTTIPIKVAAKLLDVSSRQLSQLIAQGREPFARIGVNIGIKQNYVKIYTDRLLKYLSGNDLE